MSCDDPELDDCMIVRLDKPGDFSTYTLRLVGLPEIDPYYDHVDFSFKVNCPSDLDCRARQRVRAAGAPGTGDQLPGQGLCQFPPVDP